MTNLTSDAIVFSLFPSPLSTPGGADKSYGIHVAQLAGIPRQVIHRAEEILEELERKIEARARRRAMRELTLPPALQLTLFGSETDPLVEELKTLPIILTSSCCRSRKPVTRLSAYPRSGLH